MYKPTKGDWIDIAIAIFVPLILGLAFGFVVGRLLR